MKSLISNPLLISCCLLLLACPLETVAQCPEQGIPILEDEAAVDSFLAIYPNCTKYEVGFRSIDNVRIYWIKEDPQSYLLTLFGILFAIHLGLYILFKKIPWFQR